MPQPHEQKLQEVVNSLTSESFNFWVFARTAATSTRPPSATPAQPPAAVRDGKLISMEGDYDHIVNRGSLCVKGISMFATHASPNRLTTPRYRASGSDHWEEISWDDAITRVAQKIRKTRDDTWIATEKVGDKEVPVNRTDAIGFMGGAQNTNEECYLFQKAVRLLGSPYVEHQARL